MRAEGPRFFHKAPLYLWTFSIRQGLGIVASSNADQNWRQWPFATTRVRTRRHTTLLSERGAFTDGICEASHIGKPGGQFTWRAGLYARSKAFCKHFFCPAA